MDTTAFTLFGIDIKWYAIIVTTAMMLGTLYTLRQGKKEGFKEDDILDISIMAIPTGIIFARLYYVIFNWEYYNGDIMKILNTRGGGLAVHGGIVGGLLAVYFVTKKHNMNFWKLGDILGTAMPLAQAIGRWGNYVNQEAHGGPTDLPWGIMVDGVKVHPTFLYESLWNLMVFGILIRLRKDKKFDGQLMGLYMILYSIGRFAVEGLRTDSLYIGALRTAQLVSVGMVVVGAMILYFSRNKGKSTAYKCIDKNIEEKNGR
ncbi:MAG: prolipoprotein diacylglyceryl transferase [Filifactoraceae bacterium]